MKLTLLFALLPGLLPGATYTWWVDACTASAAEDTGCRAGDPELAAWALEAWSKASDNKIELKPASAPAFARLCYRWAGGHDDRYGETRPTVVGNEPGAEMFVFLRHETLGKKIAGDSKKDPLFRDTVVFLTCVHEAGHALGLPHSKDFDDIMYDFRHGGDLYEYFARFRRKLNQRADIQTTSAITSHDREALKTNLASQASH